jgi:hypothetical protein
MRTFTSRVDHRQSATDERVGDLVLETAAR